MRRRSQCGSCYSLIRPPSRLHRNFQAKRWRPRRLCSLRAPGTRRFPSLCQILTTAPPYRSRPPVSQSMWQCRSNDKSLISPRAPCTNCSRDLLRFGVGGSCEAHSTHNHAQLRRVRCGHQDFGSSIRYIGSCKQFPTCYTGLEYVSCVSFVVSSSWLSRLSIPPEVVISHLVGAPLSAVSCTVRLIQTKIVGRCSHSHARDDFALAVERLRRRSLTPSPHVLVREKSAMGIVPNMQPVWKECSGGRIRVSDHNLCDPRCSWQLNDQEWASSKGRTVYRRDRFFSP